ncbi:MAG: glycosyltransferase [Candidatus Omnitrophota bacterium]
MARLLSNCEANTVHTVFGRDYLRRISSDAQFTHPYFTVYELNPTGRFGWGRVKKLLNDLLIPFLTCGLGLYVQEKKIDVIVTVAHGRLCICACLIASILRKPLVMFVHDDWALLSHRGSIMPSYRLHQKIFAWMLRRSEQIFAVSPAMVELVMKLSGRNAILHMPAINIESTTIRVRKEFNSVNPKFAYFGSYAAGECLDLLVRTLQNIKRDDTPLIFNWEFHLFVNIRSDTEALLTQEWNDRRIYFHPWVPQEKLAEVIAQMDVLVLPHPFYERDRYFALTSFPAKTSDYLKSGKLILVIAPHYSILNRYAKQYDFAEIVEGLSENDMMKGLRNLWSCSEYRNRKLTNAAQTLVLNHNIERQRGEFGDVLRELIAKK